MTDRPDLQEVSLLISRTRRQVQEAWTAGQHVRWWMLSSILTGYRIAGRIRFGRWL